MEFGAIDPRLRYGIVVTTIVALAVAVGWAVLASGMDPRFVMAIPLVVLFIAGLTWDRIFLHGEAV